VEAAFCWTGRGRRGAMIRNAIIDKEVWCPRRGHRSGPKIEPGASRSRQGIVVIPKRQVIEPSTDAVGILTGVPRRCTAVPAFTSSTDPRARRHVECGCTASGATQLALVAAATSRGGAPGGGPRTPRGGDVGGPRHGEAGGMTWCTAHLVRNLAGHLRSCSGTPHVCTPSSSAPPWKATARGATPLAFCERTALLSADAVIASRRRCTGLLACYPDVDPAASHRPQRHRRAGYVRTAGRRPGPHASIPAGRHRLRRSDRPSEGLDISSAPLRRSTTPLSRAPRRRARHAGIAAEIRSSAMRRRRRNLPGVDEEMCRDRADQV